MVRIKTDLSRIAVWHAPLVWVLLVMVLSAAHSEVLQTPASEEQRQRSQSEAAERLRLRDEPNVVLPVSTGVGEDSNVLTLPAEASCVTITQFILEVPTSLSPAQRTAGASDLAFDPFRFVQDYLHLYRGRCIGQAGMSLIVQRLTHLIQHEGYGMTRIGMANQDAVDGVLTLTLIPGLVRAIRFADPGLHGTPRNAFPAGTGQLLNMRDLEQGLEQLKRLPHQEVDMRLVATDMPGEIDVVLDVKRGKPYTLTFNLDDSGAQGTGRYQGSVNLGLNNLLGISDMFNLGVHSDTERQGGRRGTGGFNLYYAVPAGYWNYAISASDTNYHQTSPGVNEDVTSSGRSKNLELRIAQQFQRNATQKNSWQLKIGKRWSRAYVNTYEIDGQKRNTTQVELGWLHKHYFGNAQLDLTLANRWGSSLFGGMPNVENRRADSWNFMYAIQSLDATLTVPFHVAKLPLTYLATLRGQTTRSRLYTSDQLSVGGRYTVRGFDGEYVLSGERGFYVRNELSMPVANTGQSIYVALDAAKVYGPSVHELVGDKLAGAAVGMRGGAGGFTYDVFSGWSLYKPVQFKTATPAIGVNLAYQY